ncbi:MYCBP-associated protein [Intoshia linei]|uniref:MYCBP-associated protein n=1 Tax=Intoshia linei TaxID=1819745 RepID=A0A177B0V2_9BILA|nr:MYCBP-associated protein [Intoshia linei]
MTTTGIKNIKNDKDLLRDKHKKAKINTPDKISTPPRNDNSIGDLNPIENKRIIIEGEDVFLLKINQDKLEKIIIENAPLRKTIKKKTNKIEKESNVENIKLVNVLKKAPKDAKLKSLVYSDFAGPNFDDYGNVIPHSIIGTVAEYKSACQKYFNVNFDEKESIVPNMFESPSPRYSECGPFKNWKRNIKIQNRQINNIKKVTGKKYKDVLISDVSNFRVKREMAQLMEKFLPEIENGHGYRRNSEFWNQCEFITKQKNPLHISLNLTQKGLDQFEFIGFPAFTIHEKGIKDKSIITTMSQIKNPYFRKRWKQLLDFDNLDIINKKEYSLLMSNRTSNIIQTSIEGGFLSQDQIDDVNKTSQNVHQESEKECQESQKYPTLEFDDYTLHWPELNDEDDDNNSVQNPLSENIAYQKWIFFETFDIDEISEECINITNSGPTSISYKWVLMEKIKNFDIPEENIHNFYFISQSGTLYPNQPQSFKFYFKSSKIGMYREKWLLKLEPSFEKAGHIIISMKGVCTTLNKAKERRKNIITKNINRFQNERISKKIIYQIIEDIRPFERPVSPIESFQTHVDVFKGYNPNLHYSESAIRDFSKIFRDVAGPKSQWDMNIESIICNLDNIKDKGTKKQDIVTNVNKLGLQRKTVENVCRIIISEIADKIAIESIRLKILIGFNEITDNYNVKHKKPKGIINKLQQTDTEKANTKDKENVNRTKNMKMNTKIGLDTKKSFDLLIYNKYYDKLYISTYNMLKSSVNDMVEIFKEMDNLYK